MAIVCTVYTNDCIVMAADSMVTASFTLEKKDNPHEKAVQTFPISDNSQLAFLLSKVQVGITAFAPFVDPNAKTIERSITEFERDMVQRGQSVTDVAEKLHGIITNQTVYHVAGYDRGELYVYMVSKDKLVRVNKSGTELKYGIHFSGDRGQLGKLLGTDPKLSLRFNTFTVKETIDLAEFLMRFALDLQNYEATPKSAGGPVDILVLTPDGAFWRAHKYKGSGFVPIPYEQHSVEYIGD